LGGVAEQACCLGGVAEEARPWGSSVGWEEVSFEGVVAEELGKGTTLGNNGGLAIDSQNLDTFDGFSWGNMLGNLLQLRFGRRLLGEFGDLYFLGFFDRPESR